MEKIDLRVNEVGLGYQHLFIVYTDKDGQEFVIRGGPFEHILNPIDVEVGRYGSSSKDWAIVYLTNPTLLATLRA